MPRSLWKAPGTLFWVVRLLREGVRERAITRDRLREGRHARCSPLLADDRRLAVAVLGRQLDELFARPDQRDVAAHIRSREYQPVFLLLEGIVDNDQTVRRLFFLVERVIVHQEELASRLGGFHLQLGARANRGVGERQVSRHDVRIDDAAREIDTPVQILELNVAVNIELLTQSDLLRQLDRHDGAGMQSFVGNVGLFSVQRTSPYFSAQDEHKFNLYYTLLCCIVNMVLVIPKNCCIVCSERTFYGENPFPATATGSCGDSSLPRRRRDAASVFCKRRGSNS